MNDKLTITTLQRKALLRVIASWKTLKHYRVTLARLFRAGLLSRRAWRGTKGETDAANEYRPSNNLLIALAKGWPDSDRNPAAPEEVLDDLTNASGKATP